MLQTHFRGISQFIFPLSIPSFTNTKTIKLWTWAKRTLSEKATERCHTGQEENLFLSFNSLTALLPFTFPPTFSLPSFLTNTLLSKWSAIKASSSSFCYLYSLFFPPPSARTKQQSVPCMGYKWQPCVYTSMVAMALRPHIKHERMGWNIQQFGWKIHTF